jgi:MFS family permease
LSDVPDRGEVSVQTRQLSQRHQRRNFVLGVLNGTVIKLTMVLMDTQIVLSWFLSQLGVSNLLIGLLPPVRMGSSFLLQILVSGHLQQKPYKLPFYRAMGIVRCAALFGLALAVGLIPLGSRWLVVAFFALLTLYSMCAGLTSIAFMDVVAKAVPARRRGTFFSQRSFWGGILALGGGSLVGFLLAEPDGLRFPINVALLFALAALTLMIVVALWSMVREAPSEVVKERVPWAEQFRRGGRFLRDNGAYRTYLMVQVSSILAMTAGAFYIVYAKQVLGVPARMIGVYLTARTGASIVSNLFWGRISDRAGNRRLIQITNALGLAMPLIALALGMLGGPVEGAPWLPWAYALVFVASGASLAGVGIARTNYLLDVAPAAQRPLYLGFTNTVFGLARFGSLVNGLIVDWAGFETLFIVSAGFYGLALLLSLTTMAEPRHRSRDS